MPTYTLYYFNARGRAEVCRILFAVADVKYLDRRFELSEWERYRKDMPGMCLPVLEMDGVSRMPETMAIARYLGREFGFHGRNSFDMLRCDYLCDCFYEIMHDYMRYFHWKNGRFRNPMCTDTKGKPFIKDNAATNSRNSTNSNNPVCPDTKEKPFIKDNPATHFTNSDNPMCTDSKGNSTSSDNYLQWQFMSTCDRVLPFLEKTISKCEHPFFLGDQMLLCDMMCYSFLENPLLENKAMFAKYPKLMALRDRVSAHPKVCAYLKDRCISNW